MGMPYSNGPPEVETGFQGLDRAEKGGAAAPNVDVRFANSGSSFRAERGEFEVWPERRSVMKERITISVIEADVGGWVGHSSVHEDLIGEAKWHLETARAEGFVLDFHITACGDTLQLILTHRRGERDEEIHHIACRAFETCFQIANKLGLCKPGQDLLPNSFSGDVEDAQAGSDWCRIHMQQ
jgi:hypothetical protein